MSQATMDIGLASEEICEYGEASVTLHKAVVDPLHWMLDAGLVPRNVGQMIVTPVATKKAGKASPAVAETCLPCERIHDRGEAPVGTQKMVGVPLVAENTVAPYTESWIRVETTVAALGADNSSRATVDAGSSLEKTNEKGGLSTQKVPGGMGCLGAPCASEGKEGRTLGWPGASEASPMAVNVGAPPVGVGKKAVAPQGLARSQESHSLRKGMMLTVALILLLLLKAGAPPMEACE
jgi:hypothetical protein